MSNRRFFKIHLLFFVCSYNNWMGICWNLYPNQNGYWEHRHTHVCYAGYRCFGISEWSYSIVVENI